MFTNLSIQNVLLFFSQNVFLVNEIAECLSLLNKEKWDWQDENIGKMLVIKKVSITFSS